MEAFWVVTLEWGLEGLHLHIAPDEVIEGLTVGRGQGLDVGHMPKDFRPRVEAMVDPLKRHHPCSGFLSRLLPIFHKPPGLPQKLNLAVLDDLDGYWDHLGMEQI